MIRIILSSLRMFTCATMFRNFNARVKEKIKNNAQTTYLLEL